MAKEVAKERAALKVVATPPVLGHAFMFQVGLRTLANTTSSGLIVAISFASCGRSALAPLIFSRKIVVAPAAVSASSWPVSC